MSRSWSTLITFQLVRSLGLHDAIALRLPNLSVEQSVAVLRADGMNLSNIFDATNVQKIVIRGGDPWPDLNISLSKNESIPTVHGGVLWSDSVNKRFYLYGGEWTGGLAEKDYSVLSYDILNNKWDDFGQPDLEPPPQVASYGAGVGVSETGYGYYYGGWASNGSMSGWGTQSRKMSSDFYTYAYDTNTFTQAATPDNLPRAEGAMVWIPAGDTLGLLVFMGGIVSPFNNATTMPQKFDQIFVFDAQGNSWANQTATGEIPQNRRQFCIDVAWAPGTSSFNIYLWGGHSVAPPQPIRITIGTLLFPPNYDHYRASCNMVKSMSQLFVIGGTYTDTNACDLAYEAWAQHNFWTGTSQNAGDNATYWALYDPNITSNVVPVDVYSVVGGDKNGGATLKAPKNGFDVDNKPLEDLLSRRRSIQPRTPTRDVKPNSPSSSKLSAGAIAGIVIGSVAGLALLGLAWWFIGKKVVRRRHERRQSKSNPSSYSWGSTAGVSSIGDPRMSMVSQQASLGPWVAPSTYTTPPPMPLPEQLPPAELTAEHQVPGELPLTGVRKTRRVSELPT